MKHRTITQKAKSEHTFEQFQQEVEDAKISRYGRQQQARGKLVGVFTARQLRDMLDHGEI